MKANRPIVSAVGNAQVFYHSIYALSPLLPAKLCKWFCELSSVWETGTVLFFVVTVQSSIINVVTYTSGKQQITTCVHMRLSRPIRGMVCNPLRTIPLLNSELVSSMSMSMSSVKVAASKVPELVLAYWMTEAEFNLLWSHQGNSDQRCVLPSEKQIVAPREARMS